MNDDELLGSPEVRARELLSRMTLEEKAQQLTSLPPYGLMNVNGPTPEQLDGQLASGIGHIAMFSMFQHMPLHKHVETVNRIQRHLIENTRLGIPAIFHLEALNGIIAPDFTVFPTAISLGATWNPEGVQAMARILARQARAIGYVQALSPVMDIARDPRWGRVHETYGEDPLLVSAMSLAYTKGLQGDDLRTGAIATGKHFLGFATTEGGQHMAATAVGGRELREVYARPFELAIRDGGLASIMNSYSTIDGVPAGASAAVLEDLLRQDLGFTGTVVADYGTIGNLVERQGTAATLAEAAALALGAGLDVELPEPAAYGPTLVQAVRDGLVSEDLVDRSVLRVLQDKFATGLFDRPYVDTDAAALGEVARDGAGLALSLARDSIVLLSNDGVLPLSDAGTRIAVIGPHAESVTVGFPAYTFVAGLGLMKVVQGSAAEGETANMAGLEDAQSGLPPAAAAALRDQVTPELRGGMDDYVRRHYGTLSLAESLERAAPWADVVSTPGCGVLGDEPSDIQGAVALAADADVVVLALGGRAGWFGSAQTEGEGSDQANVDLPACQVELARAVAALGRPVVAVVFTGRPFALTELDRIVPTIVHVGYGGQEGSRAVAEVLVGAVDPGGRLPVTLPRHSGQIPIHSGQHLGSGYRRTAADQHTSYNDLPSTPLFPFGHGLSYTTFEYSDLEVLTPEVATDGDLAVRMTVTNTGARTATEVVQFYASHRVRGVTRPAQELVAFSRVEIEPGGSRTITASVSTGQLAHLDARGTFVFEAGSVDILVGRSSEDIRARAAITVTGDTENWTDDRPLLPTVTVTAGDARHPR